MTTQSLGKYSCDCGNEVEPVMDMKAIRITYKWKKSDLKTCCKEMLARMRA